TVGVAEAMFAFPVRNGRRTSGADRGDACSPCSHACAKPGNGLTDDQILHLIRAFISVECFGSGGETRNVVVGDGSVAAPQFSAPGDSFARLGRAERLCQRRVMIAELAFV